MAIADSFTYLSAVKSGQRTQTGLFVALFCLALCCVVALVFLVVQANQKSKLTTNNKILIEKFHSVRPPDNEAERLIQEVARQKAVFSKISRLKGNVYDVRQVLKELEGFKASGMLYQEFEYNSRTAKVSMVLAFIDDRTAEEFIAALEGSKVFSNVSLMKKDRIEQGSYRSSYKLEMKI